MCRASLALFQQLIPGNSLAGGYSAWFENAILHVARNETGGFVLSAALVIIIAGIPQDKAEELTAAAHKICPYSNAIQGNVDVQMSVRVR